MARPKTIKKANGATPPSGDASAPAQPDRYAEHDILVVNGTISDSLFSDGYATVAAGRKHEKVVLCLTTFGGEANAAYRLGRFLQTMYEDFEAFTPSMCKSAGTLVALGANRLIMSPIGEIGPLDVQLFQRDELGERKSGLTYRSALEDLREHAFELFEYFMMRIKAQSRGSVSFRLAAELAGDITTGLLSRVYDQVNPEVIGTDFRDLSVATKYGERLNEKYGNLKLGRLTCLVREYPSHDFVIDMTEAKDLFERVDRPSSGLYI